jgi:hypothetical protein
LVGVAQIGPESAPGRAWDGGLNGPGAAP